MWFRWSWVIKFVKHAWSTSCKSGYLFDALVHRRKISLFQGAVGERTKRIAVPTAGLGEICFPDRIRE